MNITSRIESLESRIAPAALFINATTATYTDVDGDHVTVKFSKPILTVANVGSVLDTAGSGAGDQLQTIDLAVVGAAAQGTNITVTAALAPASGDGFANVGFIDGTNTDLGIVTIDGDLGRIHAGDPNTVTAGLAGLAVVSMGRLGLATQAAGGSLDSAVHGPLTKLHVQADFYKVRLDVDGGAAGRIGTTTIGGFLIGGADNFSGSISTTGDMSVVAIGRDIVGGEGDQSGGIRCGGQLRSLLVKGSIIGGEGDYNMIAGAEGQVFSAGLVGIVDVRGDLKGSSGVFSGAIHATAPIKSIHVAGSLIGAEGDDSASLSTNGASANLGTIVVRGDVVGGLGLQSGSINTGSFGTTKLGNVTVVGSLINAAGNNGGFVNGEASVGRVKIGGHVSGGMITSLLGNIASVTIGGSLTGTSLGGGAVIALSLGPVKIMGNIEGGTAVGSDSVSTTGYVFGSDFIQSVFVGGSVIAGKDLSSGDLFRSGAIQSDGFIGPITIIGSIVGNETHDVTISSRGHNASSAVTDVALASLIVGGSVEHATILAGVDDVSLLADNADAQIGLVKVGAGWFASTLGAGINAGPDGKFGTVDDAKASGGGVKDIAAIRSKIAAIIIGGQLLGTPDAVSMTDHFGFVAEQIVSFNLGGAVIPLHTGPVNDSRDIGPTGDVTIRES